MSGGGDPGLAGRSVLFVGLRIPTPDLDGGSARELRVVDALLRLGARVTFAYHGVRPFPTPARDAPGAAEELATRGVEVVGPVADGGMAELLTRRGHEFHLVLLSPYSVADRHLDTVRALAPRARAVYLALDLGHVQHFRRARVTGKVPDLQRALEAKRAETRLGRETDVTLVCSAEERDVLSALCPGADVRLLSHAVDVRSSAPGFAGRSGLLFLGSFLHLANVDAMQRFVAEVLPGVRARLPHVVLRIVGSDPRGEMRRLAAGGVEALGWLPDVGPRFDEARVFVAPLRYGAGIKIKVLDAFAAGLPTVLSPVAAEGLNVVEGEHALLATSPAAFADAVVRLHQDEGLWERLAAGGRALAGRFFSTEAMEASLAGLLPRGDGERVA